MQGGGTVELDSATDARNDEVEDPALCYERSLSCCAHPPSCRTPHVILRAVAASSFGLDSATDARNDEVEDPTLCCERSLSCCARTPVMLRTPLSCCAQSQHPAMRVEHSSEYRLFGAGRNRRR